MVRPVVLVIAGSDSSGGAGISRDLEVLHDCGADAVCAITAVTAQTHTRVRSIHPVPADIVREQILTAFESHAIAAIKIGMLGTRAIVEAVAESLAFNAVPAVLDPVLASSSGRDLLDADGLTALKQRLLPLATLVTPNIPEAAQLLDVSPANDEEGMIEQAQSLLSLGARAVLLKGGHATGPDCVDILVSKDSENDRLAAPRVEGRFRGTGCTLSSAIVAELSKGATLAAACHFARRYLTEQLEAATTT